MKHCYNFCGDLTNYLSNYDVMTLYRYTVNRDETKHLTRFKYLLKTYKFMTMACRAHVSGITSKRLVVYACSIPPMAL